MKRILSFVGLFFALVCACLAQGSPVIEFERTEHDFGTIKESDGRVSTDFVFKNTGMSPLVLTNVRASCGCTTPNWPKDPIEPGKTGTITVTYNATGRPGHFQKSITVTSNASEETVRLFIKGDVTPSASSAKALYPVKINTISLRNKRVDFTSINQGVILEKKIELFNSATEKAVVSVKVPSNNAITSDEITIDANAIGWLNIKIDSRKMPVGIHDIPAFIVINKVEEKEPISFYVDITQDFSKLTVEERQNAPKIEVERTVDMGVIKSGASSSKTLSVANVGVSNALTIHQLYCANENVKSELVKGNTIKAGKNADMKITVETIENGTNLFPGEYNRQFMVISNDPNNPKCTINVKFVVE